MYRLENFDKNCLQFGKDINNKKSKRRLYGVTGKYVHRVDFAVDEGNVQFR